ncbi:hypothetical protein INT47_011941 [Mucor saturninus]|uniref:Uncharacterized protein n=1 Tax=Mucor saturninus TaxID=64648 RepID=A0A8H7R7P9_9FUNG|nr:hypothetical protein INT47_011941 [Mucor saturninus]
MPLSTFGFNAFQQTGDKSQLTVVTKHCHSYVKHVLFASWETTIVLDDQDQVIVWGFQPSWFYKVEEQSKNKQIHAIFGDPNKLLGIVDSKGFVSTVTEQETRANVCLADTVVYCSHLDSMFVLFDGAVQQYIGDTVRTVMRNVYQICGSNTHVLFSTANGVYGLGSNRTSQLGVDFDNHQEVTDPVLIDLFCGLGKITDMACGRFHSAVVVEGDVYTFGWHKDGRLGRDDMDLIGLAMFQIDGESIEVNAVQVVCGSLHTLVLDDAGQMDMVSWAAQVK